MSQFDQQVSRICIFISLSNLFNLPTDDQIDVILNSIYART